METWEVEYSDFCQQQETERRMFEQEIVTRIATGLSTENDALYVAGVFGLNQEMH